MTDFVAQLSEPFYGPQAAQSAETVARVARAPIDRVETQTMMRPPIAPSALRAPQSCARVSLGRNYALGIVRGVNSDIRAALGFDPNSRAEVLAMQRSMGWPQTGRIDTETSRRLNAKVRAYQVTLVDEGARGFGNIDGIVGPLMARQLTASQTTLLAWMTSHQAGVRR